MLKSVDQVLKPDPLVASTCGRDGRAPLTVEEHHYAVAQITLSNSVPAVAGEAFDRARNAFLYAWFSYDLGALAEAQAIRSEEHTSELQSLMRISYAVFCLKKKKYKNIG